MVLAFVLCVILNRHDAGLYLVAAISRKICLEIFRRQSIPLQTIGTLRLNTRPKTPWLQLHRVMTLPRLRPHLEINHATRISFPNQQVSAPCRPVPLDQYQTPNLINPLGVRFMWICAHYLYIEYEALSHSHRHLVKLPRNNLSPHLRRRHQPSHLMCTGGQGKRLGGR